MSDWLVLVEHDRDVGQADTPHKLMRIRDYLTKPGLFAGRRPSIFSLARSYAYQSQAYYASLLAEARGHRVAPSVQTMVELSRKSLYAHALPELNAALKRDLDAGAAAEESLFIAFGQCERAGFSKFSKLLFDWFRAPLLEVALGGKKNGEIDRIRLMPVNAVKGERRDFAMQAMADFTQRRWTSPKARQTPRWTLALLIDPNEAQPPSDPASLKRFAAVAGREGVVVEPIYPNDLASLSEYDALFIRTTTSIDNFTYRFARRAEQEGMPVIDDPVSMIRCTNKVYLAELLETAGLPAPRTEILDPSMTLDSVFGRLGRPVVLKAPDGSFSRQVHKVSTPEELAATAKRLFDDTALIIAQEYMPTTYDWRIGVLGGKALFACKYKMARGHWQIIKRDDSGKVIEGGSETLPVADAPARVIELAENAARLIGDGLYGVDIKENETGVYVIEINDNPNLEAGVEGAVLKDGLWREIIGWFSQRLEARMAPVAR
ncbi:RimK family protein [Hyphobacterium sp. CCMP332]|uniref:RimK family protein n=1 Tax=Hyphobacterium sp. CCMP332 TaxID=2749086 RepID=UPI00164FAE0E|nr:RimK family protein [Hyphobacterium sp. CCMP332]QNL20081.1 RimK family protein [Hyphobacterium sp. CCMP332]